MIFRTTEWHWTVRQSNGRTALPLPRSPRDLFVHVHILKARDPEQASVCCYPAVATGAS